MRKTKSTTSIILTLFIVVGLISGMLIKVNATVSENTPDLNVEINQVTVNGQPAANNNAVTVNVNDELQFNYKVTPSNIAVKDVNVPTQKEVVLVLDTSGSMNADFNGNSTSSDKNRKITSLKNAAKSFIAKCTGKNNIKIGIVPYSYYAGYNNEIKELMNVATQNDVNELNSYIDNIKPDGATNQGDGLRVAGRMLSDGNSNAAAQKYLIFLTDGEPTATTFKNDSLPSYGLNEYASNVYTFRNGVVNRNNYYLQYNHNSEEDTIDAWRYNSYLGNYEVNCITDFDEDTNLKYIDFNNSVIADIPTVYGKIVGQKLKNEVPNFHEATIAYGSSVVSGKTSSLKQVNDSMGGTLYSAKDSNTIDNIFNSLADEILQEYTIDSVNLNLKLPDLLEFTSDEVKFKFDGNYQVAPLDNIKYKLSSDKTTYIADPFYVSFKVKAKSPGVVNVGDTSTISYKNINGNITNAIMPITRVSIVNNQLPYINASLISPIPNSVSYPSQPIEVKYQITTEPFEYNLSAGPIDEAVFVVDLSKGMLKNPDGNNNNKWQIMQNWFTNIFLDGSTLSGQNIKFGVVGYNDSVKHPIENGNYDKLFDRVTDREALRTFLQEPNSTSHESIYPNENIDTRNIGLALKKADNLLQNKGQPNKNKAIVLINSGNVNYEQADIDLIKSRGYKIISVDLSADKDQNTSSNLKSIHSALQGRDDDYFKSRNDGGNFNFTQNDMQSVADRLKAGMSTKTLSIFGAKLNFDLGENFEAVSGLDGSGKVRTVTIPEIKYTLKHDDESGKDLWQQDPQSCEITFTIKPVAGKMGKLEFASDSQGDSVANLKNYISYNGLSNNLIKRHIETPAVNIIDQAEPMINANVVNPPSQAKLLNEIPLEYEVKPEKFNQSSVAKNIMFALDISKTTGNGNPKDEPQKIAEVKKALDANLKNSQINNASYGILTYSRNAIFEKYGLTNGLYPISTKLTATTNDAADHISVGENAAIQEFKNDFSQKYVVIISSGLSNSWKETTGLFTTSTVNNETIGEYNKIILDLSRIKSINEIGPDIQYIFNQISSAKSETSYSIPTKLKFHTNGKFSAISGLNKTSDSWYDVETPVFQVNYNLDGNGDYIPEKVPNIKFSVKASVTGTLKFGDSDGENSYDNKFAGAVFYENFSEQQIFNRISPLSIGINQDVKHGLYQNVDDGELSVVSGQAELARGATAKLAVGCDIASSNVDIKLQINSKIDAISDSNPIKVYKIVNGQLVEISGASYTLQGKSGDYDNYSINLPAGINSETKLVIIYQCKIPENNATGPFKNMATINGTEADFTLNISDKGLPDLF
ncbi:vWA domain-containing protein [Clostridium sp. YIM B02555]|uniref:vWA domain-containing protein n=1 Tax=Clostridium sp. YIM B02555 TaxID=2911968 RepID=UPI001EEDACC8|nr:vWA domain-containing protein [Clostridium sp. YIM B02555]